MFVSIAPSSDKNQKVLHNSKKNKKLQPGVFNISS